MPNFELEGRHVTFDPLTTCKKVDLHIFMTGSNGAYHDIHFDTKTLYIGQLIRVQFKFEVPLPHFSPDFLYRQNERKRSILAKRPGCGMQAVMFWMPHGIPLPEIPIKHSVISCR